jgi:hypothetical protein
MTEGLGSAAFAQALWLVAALSLAGSVHVLWLRSGASARFRVPLDAGLRLGGAPVLGANKTVAGLMAMPPAAAGSFLLARLCEPGLPDWLRAGFWPLPPLHYAVLGLACGLGFMLAELPNSFLKRRLGIGPGQAGPAGWLRWLCLILDRCDSSLGVLLVLSLLVPVTPATWLWVLALGPAAHLLFSLWLQAVGVKRRAL